MPKWSKERRAKFMATHEAKKKAKKSAKPSTQQWLEQVTDAKVYLRHAVADINKRMREGNLKQPDKAHLMAMLALSELGG